MILVETPKNPFSKMVEICSIFMAKTIFTINYIHYRHQTKLRKGNIFTSGCQKFSPPLPPDRLGRHPPGRPLPLCRHPPDSLGGHPLGRHLPGRHPSGQTLPGHTHPKQIATAADGAHPCLMTERQVNDFFAFSSLVSPPPPPPRRLKFR